MLILFLLAAAKTMAPLHHTIFTAAAAATASPNPSSYRTSLNTRAKKIHFLDYIGNKFESTAIATHNTIIQKAKEEYNHGLALAEVPPTTVPTTTASWNTYNPTVSVEEEASLWTTEGPTNESSTAWDSNDDDVQSSQGQEEGNVEEVEEISSPTPSSFPTLQVEPSSPTPTLLPVKHEDTDSPSTPMIISASSVVPSEEGNSTSPIPSSVPSLMPSQRTTQSPSVDDSMIKAVTSVPSSYTTEDGQDVSLSSTPENDQDNTDHDEDATSSVKAPHILCSILLSSSMVKSFEDTHVLLVVMTKTIHDIFESHLSKELYNLQSISLHMSTQKSQADSTSSTLRLHASFSGKASFSSDLAPTQSELIELLLLHFDVDEFNDRLKFPLRLRTLDEPVVLEVNSVFFSVEDGPLVNAAIASSLTDSSKGAVLTVNQIQIITVCFVAAALPFVVVAGVLLVLRMRYIDLEEVYLDLEAEEDDDEESTNAPVKPNEVEQEEEVSPAKSKMGNPETTTIDTIEPSLNVEIDVPLTPSAKFLLRDVSEIQSECWSSISGSFYDDIESPANLKMSRSSSLGLGISAAAAGRQHYRQKSKITPYAYDYDSQEADNGLVSALWEQHDHLEVYEDCIIDV